MTHLMYFLAALIAIDLAPKVYRIGAHIVKVNNEFADDPENESNIW